MVLKKVDDFLNMPLESSADWKFGLSTRDVYRIDKDSWELTDTSSGWLNVTVGLNEIQMLLNGHLSITDLDWE